MVPYLFIQQIPFVAKQKKELHCEAEGKNDFHQQKKSGTHKIGFSLCQTAVANPIRLLRRSNSV